MGGPSRRRVAELVVPGRLCGESGDASLFGRFPSGAKMWNMDAISDDQLIGIVVPARRSWAF